MSNRWKDENLIRDAASKSHSIYAFLRNLGYVQVSSDTYNIARKYLNRYDLNLTGKKVKNASSGPTRSVSNDDVFKENSTYSKNSGIKARLITDFGWTYRCSDITCPNPEPMWKGEPLSLHLDHINGVNNDNRLENLRFLCPNCHSQTETYGSRNRKDYRTGKASKNSQCECGNLKTNSAKVCQQCRIQNFSSNHPRKITNWPSLEVMEAEIEETGIKGFASSMGVSVTSVYRKLRAYREESHQAFG